MCVIKLACRYFNFAKSQTHLNVNDREEAMKMKKNASKIDLIMRTSHFKRQLFEPLINDRIVQFKKTH